MIVFLFSYPYDELDCLFPPPSDSPFPLFHIFLLLLSPSCDLFDQSSAYCFNVTVFLHYEDISYHLDFVSVFSILV